MGYSKKELLTLPLEERRALANDLINSILVDVEQPIPDWKKTFIEERISIDKTNPNDGIEWAELRKKYFVQQN